MRYILPLLLLSFLSCHLLEREDSSEILARVYDKFLYKKDVEEMLNKLVGDKDSSLIVTNYVNNWVQQELLLHKAELNLTEEQKNFQKLLEDYRRSLIIYAFQKEWINQQLDTNVKFDEIKKYYQENQANFELKENIIRMRYVKVASNAPKLSKLVDMMQKNDEEARSELREYCVQYAMEFSENDSVWIPFDDVLKKIPLQPSNEEDFLRNNRFVESKDSSFVHLLQIHDYKIKNAISPLGFEMEKIRNIIINQRKLEILAEMKRNLYESALDKGNAEIYPH